MSRNEQLGARIKAQRMQKGLTLKQLSERVDLSVGFLSQAERGLAAISLNSLYRLATEFGVDVKAFFDGPDSDDKGGTGEPLVVRGYERNCLRTTPDFIYYALCPDPERSSIFPEIYELRPGAGREKKSFQHKQEEFLYVLEGVLSACVNDCEYMLYPGDSMWIPSNYTHIWMNRTPHIVKVFSVGIRQEYPDSCAGDAGGGCL